VKRADRALALIALVALVGCASAIKDAKQAINVCALATTAGYRSLNVFDQRRLGEIRARAVTGDTAGAESDLALYVTQRSKAFEALDGASHVIDAANAAIDAVIAGVAKPADLLAWLPKLAHAALEIRNALDALGVRL
jgi:hypothetical protein